MSTDFCILSCGVCTVPVCWCVFSFFSSSEDASAWLILITICALAMISRARKTKKRTTKTTKRRRRTQKEEKAAERKEGQGKIKKKDRPESETDRERVAPGFISLGSFLSFSALAQFVSFLHLSFPLLSLLAFFSLRRFSEIVFQPPPHLFFF